jgi:exosortase D (VPLPA-CTERM-specific)
MSAILSSPPSVVWANTSVHRALMLVTLASLAIAFWPGLVEMVGTWQTSEEYSYGWLIPPIVCFLLWQKSDQLRNLELRGSNEGLLLIGLALVLCAIGHVSFVRLFLQYGFMIGVFGLTLAATGRSGLRLLAAPLCAMFLMVPIPHLLLHDLSEQLQLLSSSLGVALIRACQISVFLEGNVIDLGTYKLQVVDACSGLRYLFPLMAMGFLAGYFFRAAFWKKAALLLSTIPMTILMNSARIALVGLTVEYWGASMADGVLHEFEGWLMFMFCLGLLVVEMAILSRIGGRSQSLRQTFGLEFPAPRPADAPLAFRPATNSLKICAAICVAAALVVLVIPKRTEVIPPRTEFVRFPLKLDGGWIGHPGRLDEDVVATLELDDYLLANYTDPSGHLLNFYVAYYATQTGAEKASHSPRLCIPGGGWEMNDLRPVTIPLGNGASVPVNRTIITRGGQSQLVYYWFRQRGRDVTGDWIIKGYIIKDSVTSGQTDGALIRLVAPIAPGEKIEEVDQRMTGFLSTVVPMLPSYVPR